VLLPHSSSGRKKEEKDRAWLYRWAVGHQRVREKKRKGPPASGHLHIPGALGGKEVVGERKGKKGGKGEEKKKKGPSDLSLFLFTLRFSEERGGGGKGKRGGRGFLGPAVSDLILLLCPVQPTEKRKGKKNPRPVLPPAVHKRKGEKGGGGGKG